jgi:S-adenosylmethionine hydrolase
MLLLCSPLLLAPLRALAQSGVPTESDSRLSSEALFRDGAARGRIVSFDRLGNVETSFVATDLERLGLTIGDHIEVVSGSKKVTALLGESVFEARLGEWVAFVSLEGRMIISRSYGRAITALETDVDEPIDIRPGKVPTASDDH